MRGLNYKRHKREMLALMLSTVIIAAIAIPYPDINAVQVKLTHRNVNDDSTGLNLQVVAQDPSAITFGNGSRTETIPLGEIRVTLDPGTVNEKIATFNFTGGLLSDNSGGIITGLSFDGVTHHHKPGNFGSGPFYGYGAGFFNGTFTKGEIGDGQTVVGLSSQPYGQDTTASYKVNFNPMLLPTGTHVIRVDVLAHHGDQNFYSSGDISFHSKQVKATGKVTGEGHIGKNINFEFNVNSNSSKGNLEYNDKTSHFNLESTKITSVVIDPSLMNATFTGQAETKGGSEHGKKTTEKLTFVVDVTDPDKKGDRDQFSIIATDSTGAVVYQNSGMVQGHIEIHTTDADKNHENNGNNKGNQNDDNNDTNDDHNVNHTSVTEIKNTITNLISHGKNNK